MVVGATAPYVMAPNTDGSQIKQANKAVVAIRYIRTSSATWLKTRGRATEAQLWSQLKWLHFPQIGPYTCEGEPT